MTVSSLGVKPAPRAPTPLAPGRAVEVPAGTTLLTGTLVVPLEASALVVVARAGGRHPSHRDPSSAPALNRAGLATLTLNLLNEQEVEDRHNILDATLLRDRLVAVTAWARQQGTLAHVGYLTGGTATAGALLAAADLGSGVEAVVSCSGLPDLFEGRLPDVTAATLLVVGGLDPTVIELNREVACGLTACEHELVVVPGTSHFFAEPGAHELMDHLATEWFRRHLEPAGVVPTHPHI